VFKPGTNKQVSNVSEHEHTTDVVENTDSADNTEKPQYRRGIKSFVIRAGRLTKGQEGGLERQWPTMGMELSDGPIDPPTVFGRDGHVVLEIGYGMGQSLVKMAEAAPEKDFIGVEVHLPGVGSLLHLAEQAVLLTSPPIAQ